MKLSSSAIISPDKIKNYLLSPRKRNDKSKWLSRAGYNSNNWEKLEVDLREQILNLDALFSSKSEFGDMFEINGILQGPSGRLLSVCTIWIVENETKLTKFITMYPKRK